MYFFILCTKSIGDPPRKFTSLKDQTVWSFAILLYFVDKK